VLPTCCCLLLLLLQTPTVPTGRYVTIINAYGHSRCTSETSSLASLPEDCACSSGGNSSRDTYSYTNTEEEGSSSSSSRRSSSLSNDLVRTSSLDKVKGVLRKYVAKLKRPSSSTEPCFVTATACGPSQSCLVLSAQAMRAKTKQWQQASIAMAGFTSWWKA